tara:strand:- start:1371 stop:1652 length:282 start_codon:yes stop_codon:yes gene_type:complete
MNFVPVNRNLLLKLIEEEVEETSSPGILLPTDYKPAEKPYTFATLVACSDESSFAINVGKTFIVESQMIRQIEYNGESFHTITENHVIGFLRE